MLSQSQLEAFCLRQKLPTLAGKVIERIRSSDPSRRVGSSAGNVSCRFPSKKMGCTIQAESHGNELAALYMWEHDPRVHEFYDQPERLKLSYVRKDGRKIAYQHTADYFLIADHFIGWVECKTDDELQRLAKTHPERFRLVDGQWISPPGAAYAEQFGLGYQIRSSQENDWLLIRNLHHLQDYFEIDDVSVNSEPYAIVQRLFTEQSSYTLFELLGADERLPADAIYLMLIHRHFYADLTSCLVSDQVNFRVYRDALAAEVLREQELATARLPVSGRLSFEPGEALLWNGASWRVGSRHDDHVDLVSVEGKIVSLAWSSIDELLDRGELIGTATQPEPGVVEQVAARIIRSSSQMLVAARLRLDMLQGRQPVAPRSRRRFRQRFREAELTLGNGFVGLIDRTREKGNRQRKLPERAIQLMHEVLQTHYLNINNASIATAYAELLLQCDAEGLAVPSQKTFAIERHRIWNPHEVKRVREGTKAAYTLEELVWEGKGGFPPHGERPFDVVHIDHTEVDLMLERDNDGEGGSRPDRMWLSVMIDAYSRMVLAYYMSFDPPNYTNCMMLIRQCVQRHHRLPATIVVDGGKEFASDYFEVLLASLAIAKKTRPPHAPRFGAVMERLFGILNTSLWHNLRGNTKLLRNPRSMSATHDPRKLAVWTLDRTEGLFERWLSEVYEVTEHSALLTTPRKVFDAGLFESGDRAHKRQPYNEAFMVSCLPLAKTGLQKVYAGRGIKHYGRYYWCEAFRSPRLVASSGVQVRYDPFNLSVTYAYIDGTWRCCRNRDASVNGHKTERQLRFEASAERRLKKAFNLSRHAAVRRIGQFYRGVRAEEGLLAVTKTDADIPAFSPASGWVPAETPDTVDLPIYEDF